MKATCPHWNLTPQAAARSEGCDKCLKLGDTWLNLRVCLTCGHVGCCDSSKNKHASAHYQATGHPLMRSADPSEAWVWCFVDEVTLE